MARGSPISYSSTRSGRGFSGIIENNEKKKDGDRKNDDDHTQGDEPDPKE
jgi:hypothetical protein